MIADYMPKDYNPYFDEISIKFLAGEEVTGCG